MKKVFPVELEEELHRRLKHAAIDAGMTLHDLIVQVLEEQVDTNGAKLVKKGHANDQPSNRGR